MPIHISPRSLVSITLLAWISVLALVSLRVQSDGPYWGIELAAAQAGDGAVVSTIDRHGTAWYYGLRAGDHVLGVGSSNAKAYIGQSVPPVEQLIVIDSSGAQETIRPIVPVARLLALLAIAFTYVGLGAIVHRWSPDVWLGRHFLLFSGSFATAFAALPSAFLGYTWASVFMHGIMTPLVPVTFILFTLYFPKPLPGARRTATLLIAAMAVLLVLSIPEELARDSSTRNATLRTIWTAGNLLGGVAILIARAFSTTQRPYLKPIAVGMAISLTPYLVLSVVPFLWSGRSIVGGDISGLALVVLPVSFAYAILRHHMFALDALLRRVVGRTCAAMVMVLGFGLLWLTLEHVGADQRTAAIIAAVVFALAAPTIWARTQNFLNVSLYPRIDPLHSSRQLFESGNVPEVGAALTRRIRELAPVQWVACFASTDYEFSRSRNGPWHLVATNGAIPSSLPTWVAGKLYNTLPDDVQALPIAHAGLTLGTFLVGPRLNATPLTSRDQLTITQFSRRTAVLLEVALRRDAAERDAQHRTELEQLRKDLASIKSASDRFEFVLRRTQQLLGADEVIAWVPHENGAAHGPARAGESLLTVTAGARVDRDEVLRSELQQLFDERNLSLRNGTAVQRSTEGPLGHLLTFVICDVSRAPLGIVALRNSASFPFTAADEQRAREIAEQVGPWLQSGLAAARSAAPARANGLTRREQEIAALLAQGFTNRKIADHLILAEGTVAKHVEHLREKLGFQSRTQVATWAVQQGLATAPRPEPIGSKT